MLITMLKDNKKIDLLLLLVFQNFTIKDITKI